MDQATIQKLNKAIEARVRAELAWADEILTQTTINPAKLRRLRSTRAAISRILDREFDSTICEAVNRETRRAMVDKTIQADEFTPVREA